MTQYDRAQFKGFYNSLGEIDHFSGFRTVRTIWNLTTDYIGTIWNLTFKKSGFQIPTVLSILLASYTVGIRNPTIRKPDSFENRTFWRSVFKWSRDYSKTGHLCSVFEWNHYPRPFYIKNIFFILTKWSRLVTIWKPNFFSKWRPKSSVFECYH